MGWGGTSTTPKQTNRLYTLDYRNIVLHKGSTEDDLEAGWMSVLKNNKIDRFLFTLYRKDSLLMLWHPM